jgi:type II secretory pathway pseudopilin PulG
MLAISPVLILSASTRVQSRRVELSAQIARSFIDGVRSGRITAPNPTTSLTASASRNITDNTDDYLSASLAAPTSATKKDLYCVQSDGTILLPDCSSNQNNLFYIQAGRTSINGSDPKDGYRLAVRVYRKDIEFGKGFTNATRKMQGVVTAGSGDKQAPLVEIIADIANNNTSFTALCNRLGFKAGSTKSC